TAPTAPPLSPSIPASRGCIAGSASSRARLATSPAGVGRCRPSGIWTASSRSYEGHVMSEVNHWRRVVLWWLGTSIVATLLVVLLLAPILPPGNGSVEASGQVVDNTVLLGISTPVAMAVLVYFIYALIAFRERDTGAVL